MFHKGVSSESTQLIRLKEGLEKSIFKNKPPLTIKLTEK